MLNKFKDLGVGVGLRSVHYDTFLTQKPKSVSWVEVISENYMNWKNKSAGRPLQILEKIREDYPVVLHGVSLSIGSCDPLDLCYLKALKELAQTIQPELISDHLCWTGVEGENLHDLLPVPYTQEALELIVDKIKRVQDFLGRRILIENPSTYLQFTHEDMSEWEFLDAMARRADCGLLLDVNNVYVSSVNHNFNPMIYLNALSRHTIGQIHLAGHTNRGTHLIDTHDAPVCDEVWDLYKKSLQLFGNVSVMVEHDANIPPWEELELEVHKITRLRKEEYAKNNSFGAAAAPATNH